MDRPRCCQGLDELRFQRELQVAAIFFGGRDAGGFRCGFEGERPCGALEKSAI
jgi:hypothetical protein